MNTSHRNHVFSHIVSLSAVAAAIAVIIVLGTGHGGFVSRAFRRDILASINEAEVLNATDMVPERSAGKP
jgi:hypothetical protein